MKLNRTKLPYTDLVNQIKIISTLLNFFFILFFITIRLVLKPFKYQSNSMAVLSLHRLGDTIFTLPAVRALHKKYGERVVILCFPESVPLYKLEFDNIRFCKIEHKEFYFGERIAKSSVKRKLQVLKPGTIVDLTGSMISASMIFNIRADKIYGINRRQFKTIYNNFIPVRETPQLIDIYLDAITPLTSVSNHQRYEEPGVSPNPYSKILIHPFAGWKEKEWNLKKYISLASLLNKDYKVSFVVQNNQIHSDIIAEYHKLNIDVINTGSVEILIEQIKECSLFIGNDSGPVNIANFLGKPTLTIYGSTNPDYTATMVDHQLYIQKKLSCSACKNEKYCLIDVGIYKCSGTQCMNLLSVEDVYNALLPLLNLYCKKKI